VHDDEAAVEVKRCAAREFGESLVSDTVANAMFYACRRRLRFDWTEQDDACRHRTVVEDCSSEDKTHDVQAEGPLEQQQGCTSPRYERPMPRMRFRPTAQERRYRTERRHEEEYLALPVRSPKHAPICRVRTMYRVRNNEFPIDTVCRHASLIDSTFLTVCDSSGTEPAPQFRYQSAAGDCRDGASEHPPRRPGTQSIRIRRELSAVDPSLGHIFSTAIRE
jgi:hypothetical protein